MATSERGADFFKKLELQSKILQSEWKKYIDEQDEESIFGMAVFNASLEKRWGSGLFLVPPMIDLYIKELGRMMLNKLGRGKNTGIHSSTKVVIPWQVMTSIMGLLVGYGASPHVKGKKEKTYTVTVEEEVCARKIWHPMRVGKSYLAKRRFKKVKQDEKITSQYCGIAKVVVTKMTPAKIIYSTKYQAATITFYVQRYDANNMALDAYLQDILNGDVL